MEFIPSYEAVRQALSQGETGKALQALIGILEKDNRFKDSLLRTLRVAEANYNAVRQQELKGILTFQEAQREYSRINDTLLATLDDLEAGRLPQTASASTRRKVLLIAGVATLVLLVALGFWLLRKKDAGCPKYAKPGAMHVLVLPFDNLGGPDANPALNIQSTIDELTTKAGINVEVKVSTRAKKDVFNSQDAEQTARKCDADLVVYGQYKAFNSDSIRVKMGFRFLKNGGAGLVSDFRTFRDITAVQPDRDLKDAVLSLCGMLAVRERNWEFAKRWMDRIREKDPEERAMVELIEKRRENRRQ